MKASVGMAPLAHSAECSLANVDCAMYEAKKSGRDRFATWIGGVLIQRNPQGQVTHYWMCAVAGIAASVVAYWLAQRVKMHTIEPQAPAA